MSQMIVVMGRAYDEPIANTTSNTTFLRPFAENAEQMSNKEDVCKNNAGNATGQQRVPGKFLDRFWCLC